MERFAWFLFSVPAVPLGRVSFSVFQYGLRERGTVPVPVSAPENRLKVPAVPVPRSVPAKTVPTVPVSGSGSVPG